MFLGVRILFILAANLCFETGLVEYYGRLGYGCAFEETWWTLSTICAHPGQHHLEIPRPQVVLGLLKSKKKNSNK